MRRCRTRGVQIQPRRVGGNGLPSIAAGRPCTSFDNDTGRDDAHAAGRSAYQHGLPPRLRRSRRAEVADARGEIRRPRAHLIARHQFL